MKVVIQGFRSKLIVTQGYLAGLIYPRGITARTCADMAQARVMPDTSRAAVVASHLTARVTDG